MYIIESEIVFTRETFTLCEKGDLHEITSDPSSRIDSGSHDSMGVLSRVCAGVPHKCKPEIPAGLDVRGWYDTVRVRHHALLALL